jgi:hypothetical protein
LTLFQPVIVDEEDDTNSVEPSLIAEGRSSRILFPDDPFLSDFFEK